MRILHISTRLILGGSQENTVLSCEGQARLGHDVHLAYGPVYGPEGSMVERVERFSAGNQRITSHVVPDLIRAINPLRDWKATGQLQRLIEHIKPDIVHTHSSKAGIVGRAAAWKIFERSRRKTPESPRPAVVHTIHGPPFFAGQNPLVRRVYIASERFAARRCHLIISVADAMTRQYMAEHIGRIDQFVTVRSGMETERFLNADPGETGAEVRARLGLNASHFVIGTVARLADQKGHDDLLDALASDLKDPRNAAFRLVWVGDGWKRQQLIDKARGMGISVGELDKRAADTAPEHIAQAKVLLTGLVPPTSVPGIMRAMDVLAHPSYREGLPRTVPQALLCGTVPVAYDCDGTGEACVENLTGKLVPMGDKARLRHAILTLATDAPLRAKLAAKGLERCREMFSATRMVTELERAYKRAIEAAEGS